jgi:hypothetical protein
MQQTAIASPLAHRALRLARLLWACPLTLTGLLLALPVCLHGGGWRRISGTTPALLVNGTLATWLLRRHPAGPMNAMALGHVIFASRSTVAPRLLRHELEHVRQAERWGPLFPVAYLAASGWQLLHGRGAYWHNHFEVAARAAEKSD